MPCITNPKLSKLDQKLRELEKSHTERLTAINSKSPGTLKGLNEAERAIYRDTKARYDKSIALRRKLKAKQDDILKDFDEVKFEKIIDSALNSDPLLSKELFKMASDMENSILDKAPRWKNLLYAYQQGNLMSSAGMHVTNFLSSLSNTAFLGGRVVNDVATGKGVDMTLSLAKNFASELVSGEAGANAFKLQLNEGIKGIRGRGATDSSGDRLTTNFELDNDYVRKFPTLLKPLGFVYRLAGATDSYLNRSYTQAYAKALIENSPEIKNLSRAAKKNAVAEKMFQSETKFAEAMQGAKKQAQIIEEATGRKVSDSEIKERAWNIIESLRDSEVQVPAERYGLTSTFTETPRGFAGPLAEAVNKLSEQWDIKGVRPLKLAVPFVNTIANVSQMFIEATPLGYVSGALSADPTVKTESYARATTGMIAAGVLMGLAASQDEKEFAIYGAGPQDGRSKEEFRNNGFKPYSVRVGNTIIPLQYTPLAPALAIVGGYFDSKRYNPHHDEKESMEIAGLAMYSLAGLFTEQSFVKQIGTLTDLFSEQSTTEQFTTFASNLARGFIPAVSLLGDISRVMGEQPIEVKGSLMAKITRNIPVIQGVAGKPKLNSFGDPIEVDMYDRLPGVNRILQQQTADPNYLWMEQNGYSISVPKNNITISTKSAFNRAIVSNRATNADIGSAFDDVMTAEERYEFVKRTGPLIKQVISRYRNARGDGAYSEVIQKRIDKEVSAIRSRVKKRMFLGSLD